MCEIDKYLTESSRKGRTYNDMVNSLDYVIDNIVEANLSNDQKKVIKGMIKALERNLNK